MLGLAAALYTVIRYQITVDISKIMCIYFAKLACGSCTFSILHNWKETLTLAGLSLQTQPLCLSSLVS